jgi:hypothetical protein
MTTTDEIRPGGHHVAELYAAHLGRPIIVVGGGPSAPEQLARLNPQNSVLIFANGHGFKLGLKPDYIVCKDEIHTETKQPTEPQLRAHGDYPILTRHAWADYRMVQWPSQGNSGQLAIALGALMGGKPILPIGFDCYQEGMYFHQMEGKNVSQGRFEGMWRSSFTRIMLRLEGAVIRALGRPLTHTFKPYDPMEVLPEPMIPAIFDKYRLLTPA